jgi:ATP-dependent protease HslVU (ClpYQ) peptidase subunit
MTCIIGVVRKDKVYIGGDSAGVSGLNVTIRKDVKVFKVGKFVIGCTSSFRMIQVLQYSFSPPKVKSKDIMKYMCTDFVDSIRTIFKEKGFGSTGGSDGDEGGVFLIGYKNRLFCIQSDYQVEECVNGFNAIGCGKYYALGALKLLGENTKPRKAIKEALKISTYFNGGVRPPFIIENT